MKSNNDIKNQNKHKSYDSHRQNKDDMMGPHKAHGAYEIHREFWSENST